MTAGFWEQPAKLMRAHAASGQWKGSRQPEQVATGPLSAVVHKIAAEDPEEIWRFTVVTDDGRHIRSADLRELMRRNDLPGKGN